VKSFFAIIKLYQKY